MRTTLDLDDRLLAAARRRAAERGVTLTAMVEEALALALAPAKRARGRYRLKWKTHRGAPMPGVDLTDRDAMFDILDGRR